MENERGRGRPGRPNRGGYRGPPGEERKRSRRGPGNPNPEGGRGRGRGRGKGRHHSPKHPSTNPEPPTEQSP
eukprot:4170352-Pyramimonas_sp.AAC.1